MPIQESKRVRNLVFLVLEDNIALIAHQYFNPYTYVCSREEIIHVVILTSF